MKIENIKKHCIKHGIICTDNIAIKILNCLDTEQYPIEIANNEDIILALFDYFSKEKGNTNKPKNSNKSKIYKFFRSLISPFDKPKEQKKITIEVLNQYIIEHYHFKLSAKELTTLMTELENEGLNKDFYTLNKYHLIIDNYIIKFIVLQTVNKFNYIDFVKVSKLIEYLKRTIFAAELLEDDYETIIMDLLLNQTLPETLPSGIIKKLTEIPSVRKPNNNSKK